MVESSFFLHMVVNLEGETIDVLRILPTQVKENCINTLYFWCKEEGIDEVEQPVDFVDYL